MTESQLREEICRVGRSLFERNYVHATAGNISARLDDGYLITPTDSCLGFLDPARLAKVSPVGEHVSGDRASKTLTLHRRIYDDVHAAGCVIHTHSTALVACSLKAHEVPGEVEDELLPALTPYFVMKVGRVPHLPYCRPGSKRCVDLVAKAIAEYARRGVTLSAVMLARLGPNVWHETPAAAMAVLEELEETARLWLHSRPPPLRDGEIEELRQAFHAQW
jgi:ribulose-5-phosphate 4-epimerase/fuculose-1-phosphate aldolase